MLVNLTTKSVTTLRVRYTRSSLEVATVLFLVVVFLWSRLYVLVVRRLVVSCIEIHNTCPVSSSMTTGRYPLLLVRRQFNRQFSGNAWFVVRPAIGYVVRCVARNDQLVATSQHKTGCIRFCIQTIDSLLVGAIAAARKQSNYCVVY